MFRECLEGFGWIERGFSGVYRGLVGYRGFRGD